MDRATIDKILDLYKDPSTQWLGHLEAWKNGGGSWFRIAAEVNADQGTFFANLINAHLIDYTPSTASFTRQQLSAAIAEAAAKFIRDEGRLPSNSEMVSVEVVGQMARFGLPANAWPGALAGSLRFGAWAVFNELDYSLQGVVRFLGTQVDAARVAFNSDISGVMAGNFLQPIRNIDGELTFLVIDASGNLVTVVDQFQASAIVDKVFKTDGMSQREAWVDALYDNQPIDIDEIHDFPHDAISKFYKVKAHCFGPLTKIKTTADERSICDLNVGERISSFHETDSDVVVSSQIHSTFKKLTANVLDLNGTFSTPGHAFYNPDGSFEKIGNILLNDGFIVHEARGIVRARTNEAVSEEDWKLYDALGIKPSAPVEGWTAWSAARKAA